MDNVVVDGFNLAYRCFYAPGMVDIRDTMGRPTGILFGFIRSLVSLRKKFPGSRLYVVWDGRSSRRKNLYPEYKANRNTQSLSGGGEGWNQIDWLWKALPVLGVAQAYNPEEEADDVIASLVRGALVECDNVILSNDQDLLQLVTRKTFLLVPTQGKRQETLYTPEKVHEDWGVHPEMIVSLRALLGDTSDNIRGVPIVPEKVLRELLLKHGSIDGIYSSNMAGLTKVRYENLRAFAKQARLNLELMTLQNVPFHMTLPSPDEASAGKWLADVDVSSDPILPFLFGT